jgi:hypothetical protein
LKEKGLLPATANFEDLAKYHELQTHGAGESTRTKRGTEEMEQDYQVLDEVAKRQKLEDADEDDHGVGSEAVQESGAAEHRGEEGEQPYDGPLNECGTLESSAVVTVGHDEQADVDKEFQIKVCLTNVRLKPRIAISSHRAAPSEDVSVSSDDELQSERRHGMVN